MIDGDDSDMIDEGDGDFFILLAGSGSDGGSGGGGASFIGVIFSVLILSFGIWLNCQGSKNTEMCEARKCSGEKVSKLIDHECICVEISKK